MSGASVRLLKTTGTDFTSCCS